MSLTAKELKNKIAAHYKVKCPPYSKMKRDELLKLAFKLKLISKPAEHARPEKRLKKPDPVVSASKIVAKALKKNVKKKRVLAAAANAEFNRIKEIDDEMPYLVSMGAIP